MTKMTLRHNLNHTQIHTNSNSRTHLYIRPDITVMVDWALKINYLSIYLITSIIHEEKRKSGCGTNENDGGNLLEEQVEVLEKGYSTFWVAETVLQKRKKRNKGEQRRRKKVDWRRASGPLFCVSVQSFLSLLSFIYFSPHLNNFYDLLGGVYESCLFITCRVELS